LLKTRFVPHYQRGVYHFLLKLILIGRNISPPLEGELEGVRCPSYLTSVRYKFRGQRGHRVFFTFGTILLKNRNPNSEFRGLETEKLGFCGVWLLIELTLFNSNS
jgi:hypothetical protein